MTCAPKKRQDILDALSQKIMGARPVMEDDDEDSPDIDEYFDDFNEGEE